MSNVARDRILRETTHHLDALRDATATLPSAQDIVPELFDAVEACADALQWLLREAQIQARERVA